MYLYVIYYLNTKCPPSHHCNGFMATCTLGHTLILILWQILEIASCNSSNENLLPKKFGNYLLIESYETLCRISYHLYNLKNVNNIHEGLLLLVKLQAEDCDFTKSNTPPWLFFTFYELHKWYQTAQSITYTVSKKFEGGKEYLDLLDKIPIEIRIDLFGKTPIKVRIEPQGLMENYESLSLII